MKTAAKRSHLIPNSMRWAGVLWLAVWVPAYWIYWGPTNFLRLCDVTVVLTCLGLLCNSALLLSSQAVASIVTDFLWCLDAGGRLLLGRHLFGGTEYMWDARFPLWLRLLSLFHVVWPVLLLWALGRIGYDRRGWVIQSGVAALVLVASRALGSALNMNFAFRDPVLHRAWGSGPIHVAFILAVLIVVIYWPTHLVLAKLYQPAAITG